MLGRDMKSPRILSAMGFCTAEKIDLCSTLQARVSQLESSTGAPARRSQYISGLPKRAPTAGISGWK